MPTRPTKNLLLKHNGEVIDRKTFYHPSDKKKVIENWNRMYTKQKVQRCEIVVLNEEINN